MTVSFPFSAPFLMDCWSSNEEDMKYLSQCVVEGDVNAEKKPLPTKNASMLLPAASLSVNLDAFSRVDMLTPTHEDEAFLSSWIDPADIEYILDKLPKLEIKLVDVTAVSPVGSPLALEAGSILTFQNMAFSPRWPTGREASFRNPLFRQKLASHQDDTTEPTNSSSDIDIDIDIDIEAQFEAEVPTLPSRVFLGFGRSNSISSTASSASSCSPSSSSSSSPSTSAASSPAWSPVNSFVRRYDNAAATAATAGRYLEPIPYTCFATAATAAAAALAGCDLPSTPETSSTASAASSAAAAASSSSWRPVPASPLSDLTLDLGYSCWEDEALFRSHMDDLEAVGLVGGSAEGLIEAAVERALFGGSSSGADW